MLKTLAATLAGSACAISIAAAQDDDVIIVEATRLGLTPAEAGTSVSIITAEDIERAGFDFAIDVLASAPGVTINQNGTFGGTAAVSLRGSATDQTLVLIDGVPVGDPSAVGGGFDFARLDTENIERIEVLRGPQSTLWGSEAIGGVISIVTKRPEDGFGGTVFAETGSFATHRGGASVSGGNETGDFRVALTAVESEGISKADEDDGFTEEDGYSSYTISGKGGLNLPGDARLGASVLYTDADTDFDGFTFPDFTLGDTDETAETEEVTANVTLDAPLFDGALENSVLVGYSQIDRTNFFGGVESFAAEGERFIARYQGSVDVRDTDTLVFGTEVDSRESGDDDTTIISGFALYAFNPTERLTLTGGVRIDDHDDFGTETTGKATLAFEATDHIVLRTAWGQGFRAPSLFQTTFFCCGAPQANTGLQPERSVGFDIGVLVQHPQGRGQIDIAYFNQETDDLIAFGLGSYVNIDEATSQGVEVSADYTILPWLSVQGNYTFTDAEDSDGNALPRVPEHAADATIVIDPAGPLSGALLVRYNGEEEEAFGAGTVDSWARLDITAQYAMSQSFELYGRIENLLDTDYQQVLGYGTPGLSGSIGVRVTY